MNVNSLVSIEIEKNCIAGILKYPATFSKLSNDIGADDFYNEIHQKIFSIARNIFNSSEIVTGLLVAQKIKNLGINVKENLNIYEYTEALSLISIEEDSILSYFDELKKFSVCRELDRTGASLGSVIRKNLNLPTSEIIQAVDSTYNARLDLYTKPQIEFVNVYQRMELLLDERANNPQEEMGIPSPFEVFNRHYGGFRPGNVYVWASRSGQGKSTWLMHMARKIALDNPHIKILYLDTEMETDDVILRAVSAMTGIPFWFLDTGNYVKNKEMLAKVKQAMAFIKENSPNNFHHRHVSNLPVDIISNIIRRWYHSQCKRADAEVQAIIIYDYLKITGEKISDSNKEYQVIGDKMNVLKELGTTIKAPILSAIQINRTGSAQGGEISDDESVISLSDRIMWFCSYLGIFRWKTMKEVAEDGEQFGTHLLKTLKGRFMGRESSGANDWVVIQKDGKPTYKKNYINYFIDKFNVEERSCLKDMHNSDNKNDRLTRLDKEGDTKDFYDRND